MRISDKDLSFLMGSLVGGTFKDIAQDLKEARAALKEALEQTHGRGDGTHYHDAMCNRETSGGVFECDCGLDVMREALGISEE